MTLYVHASLTKYVKNNGKTKVRILQVQNT